MKKIVLNVFFIFQVVFVFAQAKSGITGKIIDSRLQNPLQNAVVSIQNTNMTELTDGTGMFTFMDVTEGEKLVEVKSQGFKTQLIKVEVLPGQVADIGVIVLEEDITGEVQVNLISIIENDLGDEDSGSENTTGLLQSTRDVYLQTAAFNWGQARFKVRGLDNEYGVTMINGVSMNKIYDGRPQWGNWGGLNDGTRNQEFTLGTAPSDYTFGGLLGTQEINTRASIYRPGTRITFSGSNNSNYNWRAMGTFASGMNKNGWAFIISGGRRWAEEGYNYEGIDYSSNALFASVEKRINDKHSINFTSIYSQNSRGKNSANSQEVTDLMGIKYNSYWGWQDGEKRNSRQKDVEEPILMLSHYWKVSNLTNINTNVTYQTGSIGNSRLDYNGGNNPDPTYYKNLPSYYLNLHEISDDPFAVPVYTPNYEQAESTKQDFLANSQINWPRMYHANLVNQKAIYALYEDRVDDDLLTINSVLDSQIASNILMNASVTYKNLKSENFQYMLDLLGDYSFLDTDSFYEGYGFSPSQSQSDLNNPNRLVQTGEKYGYNYILNSQIIDAFTQFKFTYNVVDFYLAQTFSSTEYQREGLYKNGLYADNSYGKSEKVHFENFGFKGGLTYKLNGKNLISLNAAYQTKAPSLRNTFANARLNNIIIDNLESENLSSIDLSYIIRTPKFKTRLTGYYINDKNTTDIGFFYTEGLDGDGDSEDEFVSELVQGLNKRNVGAELGVEYQITSTLKFLGAASYGEFTYSNNPNVSLSIDSRQAQGLNPVVDFGTSSLKNYHQPGMPGQSYSMGFEYRDPKFWWVGVNGNYLADTYVDVDALLRTDNFFKIPGQGGISFPEATPERAAVLLAQEKLDPVYLFNLIGGKSWRIDKTTIGFFASINNLFDVDYKTGGFESSRNANFRELNMDNASGVRSFGPKYFYGFGRNYMFNLYVNF
jgi:hypothetical protein